MTDARPHFHSFAETLPSRRHFRFWTSFALLRLFRAGEAGPRFPVRGRSSRTRPEDDSARPAGPTHPIHLRQRTVAADSRILKEHGLSAADTSAAWRGQQDVPGAPGRRPFKDKTRVRIPMGAQIELLTESVEQFFALTRFEQRDREVDLAVDWTNLKMWY